MRMLRTALAGLTLTATMIGASATGANAAPAATAACKGDAAKPRVHAEAGRREQTLTQLINALQERRDPYRLNSPQITTLESARAGISALDAHIAGTCYATRADLHADAAKLFVDYRVYWLRVPQSHVIEAADRLGTARTNLAAAATKLEGLVGSSSAAKADLATMQQAVAAADAKLGMPATPGPTIAAAAALAPAADMTADTAALRAARADLVTARQSLAAARAAGLRVVADLRHP